MLDLLNKDITTLVGRAVEDAMKVYRANVTRLGCVSMTGIDKLILRNTRIPIIDGIKERIFLPEVLCRSGLKTNKMACFQDLLLISLIDSIIWLI